MSLDQTKIYVIISFAAEIGIYGPVAQLGERSVRIDMDAHPSARVGPKFWREIPPELMKA